MTSQRERSARIAMEYITARASDVRDEAADEALIEASHNIHDLVDGLTKLLVALGRRVAATEAITVERVLQREMLGFVDDAVARHEIRTPDPQERDHPPARQLDGVTSRG
jgi:hypothetical protein